MNGLGEGFSTPTNPTGRFVSSIPRSAASKRDSLAAELERDPQLNTARRKQRTQAFTSHLAQSSLERQLVAAQTAKTELESKLREKDVLIERLEGERRFLAEREEEERREKEQERAERDAEKRKSDSDLRALRNSFLALREQYADLEDANSLLSRNTANTIATQKAEISTLVHQVTLLQGELDEFKRIAEERGQAFEELQAQFEDLSLTQNDLSRVATNDENWAVVRDELHRQADHARKVEAENARLSAELTTLRQRHANAEVLREQKRELERKLTGMDELRDKVVRLEAELEAGRKERDEWVSKTTTPSQTPVSVTQSLSNLRVTYARLLEEHGSNIALLRRREAELTDSEERIQEQVHSMEKLQNEMHMLRDKAGRYEHRAQLAEREVGFLQAMVASFEAEEANQTQDGTSVTRVESDETVYKRIQDLEDLIAEYKDTVDQMEKEIQDLGGDPSSLGAGRPRNELEHDLEAERTSNAEVQKGEHEALEEAEAENEKYLEKIEELEQTLFELQGEIGGGRHVPPGVRVLSLAENPFQEWQDLSKTAMDRLRNENDALLKRLKELEGNGVVAGTTAAQNVDEVVPKASYDAVHQEKEELAQELKQKEKRLMRLKQVFSTKTDEFKEAIASILGVKLAFFPNGQVRVTSLYDLNAVFAFQPTNGGAQLVATGEGGPEDLLQLQRYWVEQEGSIPGFLASVTLECYEKWKNERLRE